MKERTPSQRGSVLVLVLLLLAGMSVLALEVVKSLRMDYAGATAFRATLLGEPLLASSAEMCRNALGEDSDKQVDSYHDDWAEFGDILSEITDRFDGGPVKVVIRDEQGRFPINALTDATATGVVLDTVFQRLVKSLIKAHGIDADEKLYLTSIKCWLGASKVCYDDDDWYEGQEIPYTRPGRQMQSLDELLLVRWEGVSREDRELMYYGKGSVPGLRDLVTVFGIGPVNLNTAPPYIIGALVPDQETKREFVEEVVRYRENKDNKLIGKWYVPIATRLGLSTKELDSTKIGVKSGIYRVTLTASWGAATQHRMEIVKRQNDTATILYRTTY